MGVYKAGRHGANNWFSRYGDAMHGVRGAEGNADGSERDCFGRILDDVKDLARTCSGDPAMRQ